MPAKHFTMLLREGRRLRGEQSLRAAIIALMPDLRADARRRVLAEFEAEAAGGGTPGIDPAQSQISEEQARANRRHLRRLVTGK